MRISDWSSDVCSSDLAREANGRIQLTLDPSGQAGLIALPASGVLAGLGDAYTQLSDSAAAIDQIAGQFVASVNAVHRQGFDLNGVAGGELFAASPLTATPSRTHVSQATIQTQAIGRASRRDRQCQDAVNT